MTNLTIPPHILEAAKTIEHWALENNHKEFVIGSICSTSCINTSFSLVKLYQNYLNTQVDPALLTNAPLPPNGQNNPPYEPPIHERTPQENFNSMFNPRS